MEKYTPKEMEILRECYESPTNEFSHLGFTEWLRALEKADNGQILKDILSDQ